MLPVRGSVRFGGFQAVRYRPPQTAGRRAPPCPRWMACRRAAGRCNSSPLPDRNSGQRAHYLPSSCRSTSISTFACRRRIDFGRRSKSAPLGPPLPALSLQRRQRLSLAIRALDGWTEGNTYRAIAEGLFGKDRIPDRAWKTHDLRNRTIRLVQSGFALMRGGYRDLLRQSRRKK